MKLLSCRSIRKILNTLSHSIIALNEDPAVKKFVAVFQRNRKLPLTTLIYFLLFLDQQSIPAMLRIFFSKVADRPSPAAVCKRRKLLAPELLHYLFLRVNKKLDQLLPDHMRYYHQKYSLLICDGSDVTTLTNAKDPDAYFAHEGKKGYNIYHINALFNPCTGRYESLLIHPRREDSERASFLEMARPYARTPAIFLLDRGYECWDIVLALAKAKNFFIMRVQAPDGHGLLSTLSPSFQETLDEKCTIYLGEHQRKTKPSKLHPDGYGCGLVKPTQGTPVTLRMLRIILKTGDTAYLLTNLPVAECRYEEVVWLYGLRWKIEDSFRKLKWNLKAIHFHSRQKKQILQELWANFIMFNICSTIQKMVKVLPEPGRFSYRYRYQASFQRLAEECRHCLFQGESEQEFLNNVKITLSPIRPGRTARRKVKTQGPKSFQWR